MPRSQRPVIWIGIAAASLAAGYAAVRSGGGDPFDLNVTLLLIAAGGLYYALAGGDSVSLRQDYAVAAFALLLPAYVALQLIPIPLSILAVVNPARADVARALEMVTQAPAWAPATILPSLTWHHLSRVAGYSIVFLLARHVASSVRSTPWRGLIPLIAIGIVEAALGLAQNAAGTDGVLGTYLNKNHFAGLLEMVLPLAVALTLSGLVRLRYIRPWSRSLPAVVLGVAASLAMFVAIALSLSRAGFLSMLASLLAMGGIALALFGRSVRWTGLPAIAVAGLALLVFAPPDALVVSFGEMSSDPAENGRWLIALDTLRLVRDYPLLGIGLGTYYPGLLPYQTASLDLAWVTAHNDYLQLLAELGVVGFAIPAFLVIVALKTAVDLIRFERKPDVVFAALGCLGSLLAMLIHSAADFNMAIPANAIVFAYIAGFATGLPLAGVRDKENASRATAVLSSALRGGVVVLSVSTLVYATTWLFVLGTHTENTRPSLCWAGFCNPFAEANALAQNHYGDVSAAPTDELVRLLEQDPAGGYQWLNVGESLELRGEIPVARASIERALELGPHIPNFLVRAAHFHLRQEENTRGLELLARSVAGNRNYQGPALEAIEQHEVPVDDVLAYGLADAPMAQAYLRWLLAAGNSDGAAKTWTWVMSQGWADAALASDYAHALVEDELVLDAMRAWLDYQRPRQLDYFKSTFVFDGGFELEPTRNPFAWTSRSSSGVSVDRDSAIAFEGTRSARVRFDGSQNVENIGLVQRVVLPPGRYELSAFLKVEDVTTREGVSIVIRGHGVEAATAPLAGSQDWTRVHQQFEVPEGTGVLELRAARRRSLRFDNQISGTAWIDQVRISPVGAGAS